MTASIVGGNVSPLPVARSTLIGKGERGTMPDDETRLRNAEAEKRYWEWLLHEGGLFSSRVRFFLGAETLFFIVFAINSYELAVLTQVTGALGTLFGVIWVYVSMFWIFVQLNPIKSELYETSDE